jgi:hypothetical protein
MGLPFSDQMLHHEEFDKDKAKGKRDLNAQAITTASVKKWEKAFSTGELRRMESLAYDTMQLFGYEPKVATGQRQLSKPSRILGEVWNLNASIFVGNRYNKDQSMKTRLKNLSNTIRRNAVGGSGGR